MQEKADFEEYRALRNECEDSTHSFTAQDEWMSNRKASCRYDAEKAEERCEKLNYQYWEGGECKVNEYLKCQESPTEEWNYDTRSCEVDPVTECIIGQGKAWDGTKCTTDFQKECETSKSKYWTGTQCINASELS